MFRMTWTILGVSVLLPAAILADEPAPLDALAKLGAVYKTAPQGYPTGKDERGTPYAQPDTGVWYRWHFYHDDAIPRCADAKMVPHADAYNLLEGEGVSADVGVKFAFGTEHVTAGKQALRVEFPGGTDKEVRIKAVAGLPAQQLPNICLGSNYRWLKFDAFNPAAKDVGIRACGVPFVLCPGANVVAVKTADASGYKDGANPGNFSHVTVALTAPAKDATLFLDNVRLEQEKPTTLSGPGRYLHFSAKGDGTWVQWPGATPLLADTLYSAEQKFGWTEPAKTRAHSGLSFRSHENGVIWGRCVGADASFRVDVPSGRHGIYLMANPVNGFDWQQGATLKVNGKPHVLIRPKKPEDVHRLAFGGETWDFQPGACVWEALVRPAFFPPTETIYADAVDGRLLLEMPKGVALRMLMVFPEKDREAALKEIGRFNFLMAESWDVAHPWVKGDFAERGKYIGFHDEAAKPETIPERLQALRLTSSDFKAGFKLFARGLEEAVYPDTVPTPEEAAVKELRGFATPGQRTWLTLGLLPLGERKDLRITWEGLTGPNGTRIPAGTVRVARQQQKCMEYGHHNHAYNYQEHYLVPRPQLELHPGAARRLYLEITVPAKAPAGEYSGRLAIVSAQGETVAAVPVHLEVLPLTLREPEVFWCTEGSNPLLKNYGINTCTGDHDEAVKQGFKAFALFPYYQRNSYKGKDLGSWPAFAKNQALLKEMCDAGRAGKGPRAFFRGSPAGSYWLAEPASKPFFDGLLKEIPELEVLNVNVPTFQNPAYKYGQARPGAPAALKSARDAGKDFWFFDWVRYSKEQTARFSCGVWLWRTGASGRYTTFGSGGDYHYGTAKETYPGWGYYTHLGVVGGNYCGAVIESIDAGQFNPSRDLVLVAEGVNDYRYLHTLDAALASAEAAKKSGPALDAARKFRDALMAEVSLDLAAYYESRYGSYAENWYPRKDNPWSPARFARTRKSCAEHILALQKSAGN